MGMHWCLTVPEIFELGIVVRYWNFLIMGLAFLGVGLSEFSAKILSHPNRSDLATIHTSVRNARSK